MTKHASRAAAIARPAARPRIRRAARPTSLRRRVKTAFAVVFLAIETVLAIALVFLLVLFWRFSTNSLTSVEAIASDIKPPVPTTIWSEDGVLLAKLNVENRQPVTLDDIPKTVLNATIAVEDHRFYEHRGVDLQGIARAAYANVTGSSLKQGGSTLTQQLVRNLHEFGLSREKRFTRKLREALIAVRLEQVYSKREILQLYLNDIYYGAGAYGIQAASLTYFGKSAYKLDVAEAALLAGLPQRPSAFLPFDHLAAALKRRNDVLDRMQAYGYITQQQCAMAKAEKPKLMPRPEHKNFNFKAPYFVTYVLRDLTRRYGSEFVYSGLKIETTLNWKQQQWAESALEQGLARSADKKVNQGALVSIDNRSGYIRAMVGGRSFRADQYNAITQGRRQPGSTFKLFDYASAFDTETYNLNSEIPAGNFAYPGDPQHRVVKGKGGSLDIRNAIKYSRNEVAVRVAEKVGIKTVIEYAKKMGITTPLESFLPTALGASAVRPLDLCSAYSVLPTRGSRYLPMALVRVTDAEGYVVEEHVTTLKTDILKQKTVDWLNEAFEGVVTGGTGTAARGDESNGIVENAHGKTGTTNENRDVWFAGYTPELTTVVWAASVHRNERTKRVEYREMTSNTYGGTVCAPIWHDFMVKAAPEERKFKPPQLEEPGTPATTNDEPTPKPRTRHRRSEGTHNTAPKEEPPPDTTPTAPEPSPDNTEPTGPDSPDTSPVAPPSAPPEETAPRTTVPRVTATPTAPIAVNSRPNVSSTSPTTAASGRLRAAAPPVTRPAPAAPEMVTVHICVDSGDLANSGCSAFKIVTIPASQAKKMRHCRLHHPPPGEN